MLDVKTFLKAIYEIQKVHKYQSELYDLFKKYDSDTRIYPYSCEDVLVDVLEKAMKDDNSAISYFIYDLNFGKDWTKGCFTRIDERKKAVDIKIKTPEDLYNYLVDIQVDKILK